MEKKDRPQTRKKRTPRTFASWISYQRGERERTLSVYINKSALNPFVFLEPRDVFITLIEFFNQSPLSFLRASHHFDWETLKSRRYPEANQGKSSCDRLATIMDWDFNSQSRLRETKHKDQKVFYFVLFSVPCEQCRRPYLKDALPRHSQRKV